MAQTQQGDVWKIDCEVQEICSFYLMNTSSKYIDNFNKRCYLELTWWGVFISDLVEYGYSKFFLVFLRRNIFFNSLINESGYNLLHLHKMLGLADTDDM